MEEESTSAVSEWHFCSYFHIGNAKVPSRKLLHHCPWNIL